MGCMRCGHDFSQMAHLSIRLVSAPIDERVQCALCVLQLRDVP